MIQLLLDHGADIYAKGRDGIMPIHTSIYYGNIRSVHALLDHGADIEAKDNGGATPLIYAVFSQKHEILDFLLSKGANIHAETIPQIEGGIGFTPFADALLRGDTESIKILIKHGLDVNAENVLGDPSIYDAIQLGHNNIVKLLISESTDPDIVKNSIHEAIYIKNTEMLKFLLAQDDTIHLEEILIAAVKQRSLEMVKIILDQGADVNAGESFKETPLYQSVLSSFGSSDIPKLLLERGANIDLENLDKADFVRDAIYGGHTDIVKLLLEQGVDVHLMGYYYNYPFIEKLLLEEDMHPKSEDISSPHFIHGAVRMGHTDTVKLLLEHGVDVNLKGCYGILLHEAIRYEHNDIVKLLLESGAELNADGSSGEELLQTAVHRGQGDIVKLLLEHGATYNDSSSNTNKETFLHVAVRKGYTDIVKILLENNADAGVNIHDEKSPLLAAVWLGDPEMVAILLKANASIDVVNYANQNLTQIAEQNGDLDIAAFLEEYVLHHNSEEYFL